MLRPTRPLLVALVLSAACTVKINGSDTDASTGTTADTTDATTDTSTSTDGSTSDGSSGDSVSPTEGSSGGTTVDPDPNYVRECQPNDFTCDDWGCDTSTAVALGQCYKPCTPDGGIGEPDSECDEPARPFCSQVGQALGGDFDCNGCVHVCIAEPLNQCNAPANSCG